MKTQTIVLTAFVLLGIATAQASEPGMARQEGEAFHGAFAANVTGDLATDIASAAAQDEPARAQNLLEAPKRKNPVVTGLMSLAVPGAGQIYTGNYLRGALYLLAEAAAITAGVVYNNKGDRKTDEFQTYADAHWSAVKYVQFLNTYAGKYRTNKDNAKIAIDPNTSLRPWQRVDWNAINAYE
ncbi:MAG: hypothetical protein ACM3Q4_09040, partial [Acidobacteriota bacterium]